MLNLPAQQPNAFQETLLGLGYTNGQADLFSRACVEQYHECDWQHFGYLFAQVFEPNVLLEVSMLEGVPYPQVEDLTYRPTAAMATLRERVAAADDLPVVALVNLAAALVSISRFSLADAMLDKASTRAIKPRDAFEVAMLKFVVSNRNDGGVSSPWAFARMREAIESGKVPSDRVMDACTQAIVWYLKRQEVVEADFHWYLAVGRRVVTRPGAVDQASVSNWYRALAMVPAAKGRAAATHEYMRYAFEAAQSVVAVRPRAYEMHLIKTFYESSLKEHMYVAPNADMAEETGQALIDVDPEWAPSYGEAAEAYARFGKQAQAAAMYDKAAELGPPYFGHHLYQAALCHEKCGNPEQALSHYQTLSRLAPENEAVLAAGLKLARLLSDESCSGFETALARLGVPSIDLK